MISFSLSFDVFLCVRLHCSSMREYGIPVDSFDCKVCVCYTIFWAWVTGGLHVNMNEEYDIKKLPI